MCVSSTSKQQLATPTVSSNRLKPKNGRRLFAGNLYIFVDDTSKSISNIPNTNCFEHDRSWTPEDPCCNLAFLSARPHVYKARQLVFLAMAFFSRRVQGHRVTPIEVARFIDFWGIDMHLLLQTGMKRSFSLSHKQLDGCIWEFGFISFYSCCSKESINVCPFKLARMCRRARLVCEMLHGGSEIITVWFGKDMQWQDSREVANIATRYHKTQSSSTKNIEQPFFLKHFGGFGDGLCFNAGIVESILFGQTCLVCGCEDVWWLYPETGEPLW